MQRMCNFRLVLSRCFFSSANLLALFRATHTHLHTCVQEIIYNNTGDLHEYKLNLDHRTPGFTHCCASATSEKVYGPTSAILYGRDKRLAMFATFAREEVTLGPAIGGLKR